MGRRSRWKRTRSRWRQHLMQIYTNRRLCQRWPALPDARNHGKIGDLEREERVIHWIINNGSYWVRWIDKLVNHCGQWIFKNDWCGKCGGCGCGADNFNPHNPQRGCLFQTSTPFERKKSAESDSSEVPQLVRSQSVQSLTTNLHALAEELSVRSLRELQRTFGTQS